MCVSYHDYKPREADLYQAVTEGLAREPKTIPPKFFYDQRGSELFEQICRQPEYYLPDVERAMLRRLSPEIAGLTGSRRVLIEPGAGALQKVRLLLDDLNPSAFAPMDISFDHLKVAADELAADYPSLPIHVTAVDFTHSLPVPDGIPDEPRLVFFPGSSLGNFDHQEAGNFLQLVRETVGDDGMFLIGVDTKKPDALLNAAYNDAAGVTAEFNLNLLHRLRGELAADLDPTGFRHHASYNPHEGRVEMHLVSERQQQLRLGEHRFDFEPGDIIHTENSYKYAPQEFLKLAQRNGFAPVRHWLDDDELFAIYLLRAA